jgi:type II secretory pathway predicted ATPase ExeA
MTSYAHLAPSALADMHLPASLRARTLLGETFVVHKRLASLLTRVDELVDPPSGEPVGCMVVSGKVGSGKTVLARQLQARYGHAQTTEAAVSASRAVTVNMAGIRHPGALFYRLLSLLPPAEDADAMPADLETDVGKRLTAQGARLLVIDEAQCLFELRKAQRLSLLRSLVTIMDRYRLPVVLLTVPSGVPAIEACTALNERLTYETLPTWSANAYLAELLVNLERTLPLHEASHLGRPAMMDVLVRGSGGALDAIVDIVRMAAAAAIARGWERITLALLKEALQDRRDGRWPASWVA